VCWPDQRCVGNMPPAIECSGVWCSLYVCRYVESPAAAQGTAKHTPSSHSSSSRSTAAHARGAECCRPCVVWPSECAGRTALSLMGSNRCCEGGTYTGTRIRSSVRHGQAHPQRRQYQSTADPRTWRWRWLLPTCAVWPSVGVQAGTAMRLMCPGDCTTCVYDEDVCTRTLNGAG
jgi:hypothetical protein